MRRSGLPFLFVLLLVLVLPARTATAAAAKPAPDVLARVGDDVVDAAELRAEFVERHGGHARFLGGESEIRAFLDQVIDRRLLLQEAYRLGIDQQKDIVEATNAYAENQAVEWLVSQEIDAKAQPTEDEIREAWKTRTTEVYRVLQLVLPDRAAADKAAADLAAGADFGELARERSVGRSRTVGGMLSQVAWGSMTPEWESVVFALEPGQTSAPFESREGWEIDRMVEKATVDPPEYSQARNKIEGILKRRKLDTLRREYGDALWAKYHARIEPGVELAPSKLADELAQAPQTKLADWDGGSLDLGTFARGIDFRAFAVLPPDQASGHLEQLVRRTVNDFLVRLEVRAKKTVERPEIAAQARAYRENLMERALYADYVLKGLTVSDADVRAWYDAHQKEFVSPERRRVAHLVTATREEAEALRQRIAKGEDFEELVRSSSTDVQTRKSGGDLGWVTRKQTPPGFEPVFDLKLGEVSQPLQSKFGWHLIEVKAIDPARPQSFDEVKDDLRKELIERRKTELRAEWVAKLRAATPIEIFPDAIQALAKKEASDV
jgi:parvulin-like peptidyl-prolyl isomerase